MVKTREQHKASGTYREERHAGPDVKATLPTIPDWLAGCERACELWDEIGGQLLEIRCISEADRHPFAQLVYNLYRAELIANRSLTSDEPLSARDVTLLKEHNAHSLKLLIQFGMSPKSRTGLTSGKVDDHDPLVSMIKRREK
jgi:hypothetical protein